jgi:predicted regulator of Ras-like GTPase activity (Roadblock/LC7/MglB family)
MSQSAELDDRIAKCNRILEENPNSQIFAALAEAYRKKGDLDKAFRACQNGLRVHPNYGSAHMVMAKINFDKGLYDWAEIEVNKAIELEGVSQAAELLLAEIYLYRGEAGKAVKILNRLSAADKNNPQVQKLMQVARKIPQERFPKEEPEPKFEKVPKVEKKIEIKSSGEISINQLLDQIDSIPGVEGALLINDEGLVAESRWDGSTPPDLFGAVACDIIRTIKSQIDICQFGQYESVLIEADGLMLNIISLRNNLLLIKTNNKINLGTLRLRLSGLLTRLPKDFSMARGLVS